ncbi:MAG: helicase [Chloroflexus sp.]|uniref:helicase n=1 Tax=Chloroflexus sp. TaxID=1904827 RepID=UPI003094F20F
MSDLIDILQTLAARSGRSSSPLITLRSFPPGTGTRISHLAVDQGLQEAWVQVVGTPFFQAQSIALAALRRGTPFAITGSSMVSRASLHLVTLDLLRNEPSATALLIAPDPDLALLHEREAMLLARYCRPALPIAATGGMQRRVAPTARLVITTLPELHNHLLRFHDRAWRFFWQRLRLIVIADLHVFHGVAAAHLAMTLLRAARLTSQPLLLGGSLAAVSGAETALTMLTGREWRITAVDDLPRPATTLALWQSDGERRREIARLAEAFLAAGAAVRLVATPWELADLRTLVDHEAFSVGTQPMPAHVQIITGADVGAATVQAALASGAVLVVLILGRGMTEPALQRLAVTDLATWPLLRPPVWPPVLNNSFVSTLHLVCAASEQPLRAEEIRQWQVESMVEQLTAKGYLSRLPDMPPVWLPGDQSDPYIPLDLHAAGTEPIYLLDEQGRQFATTDSSLFHRWMHPAAGLPPLRGGQQVIARDEDQGTITLARRDGRRTLPLRQCQVQIREEWAQRELRRSRGGRGPLLSWGRVVVEEQVYAYREQIGREPAQERKLATPLTYRWQSPAVWVRLGQPIHPSGQQVGWSVVAAAALITLARVEDCVPAYDPATNHLYLIDAQNSGNGLAEWLYDQIETILPLAYDIALEQRTDPLFEPLARTDMDWLLAVLSGETEVAIAMPALSPGRTPGENRPARTPEPPVREPPVRSEPPAREPPVREPPVREPPVRSEPPVREPPAREPPARSAEPPVREPPAREPSVRSEPPAREPPVRSERSADAQRGRYNRPGGRHSGRRVPDQPEPPEAPAVPEPPTDDSPAASVPDAEAILARLRQRRERNGPAPTSRERRPEGQQPLEPRFQPGDRIICMPYGAGRVRASIVSEGRELLLVEFDEHGELRIDPSVNIVRRLPPVEDEGSE